MGKNRNQAIIKWKIYNCRKFIDSLGVHGPQNKKIPDVGSAKSQGFLVKK